MFRLTLGVGVYLRVPDNYNRFYYYDSYSIDK